METRTIKEDYSQEEVHQAVINQREYFNTDETLAVSFRINQLKKLKKSLYAHEKEILEALHEDLGRSETEAYLCDFGAIILELNETLHGLRKWARPETHYSGLVCFPSVKTKVYKMPYGVTLIISPFNFPFLLSIGVLIASIAGGNTAILKASSKSKKCTEVLCHLIEDTFEEKYVKVIAGGHDVADYCLQEKFDKIFYTGSPKIGKRVLRFASDNLIPVALELGGETGNWAIVRKDADIHDAARKIAFFKACNSGQICININQVAVEKSVAEQLIEELKSEFNRQLGLNPIENEEYAHLINQKAYNDCKEEASHYQDRIVYGGIFNDATLQYSPTIIYPVSVDEPIVNHELFNPLLPIVVFEDGDVNDLIQTIKERERGLAFYLFTKDYRRAKKIMTTVQYGGGCINEVCVHMMVKGVPFNGVGHSGMGAYHGIYGFREFTHPCSVLFGKTKFNLSLREHPYSKKKLNLIKKVEK